MSIRIPTVDDVLAFVQRSDARVIVGTCNSAEHCLVARVLEDMNGDDWIYEVDIDTAKINVYTSRYALYASYRLPTELRALARNFDTLRNEHDAVEDVVASEVLRRWKEIAP